MSDTTAIAADPAPETPAAEPEITDEIVEAVEPEPIDEADELEELEVDGRKGKVSKTLKEFVEMGKDYRFKTGKVAEEKRAVDAVKKAATETLERASKVLKAYEPVQPDPVMLDRTSDKYDPDAYHLQRAKWETWARQMYEVETERQANAKARQDEETAAQEKARARADAEARKAIPKWKDQAIYDADRTRIKDYATKALGVSAEDAASLDYDHRLTLAVYKAMLYDQAVERAAAKKTAAPEPETPPPAPLQRRVTGGAAAGKGGPPKDTESYIKWRLKGGKM